MIVYLVTCSVSGKLYVGITSHRLSDRWSAHLVLSEETRRKISESRRAKRLVLG